MHLRRYIVVFLFDSNHTLQSPTSTSPASTFFLNSSARTNNRRCLTFPPTDIWMPNTSAPACRHSLSKAFHFSDSFNMVLGIGLASILPRLKPRCLDVGASRAVALGACVSYLSCVQPLRDFVLELDFLAVLRERFVHQTVVPNDRQPFGDRHHHAESSVPPCRSKSVPNSFSFQPRVHTDHWIVSEPQVFVSRYSHQDVRQIVHVRKVHA